LVNKAFFGKTTCLKFQLHDKDVYLHMGLKKGEAWEWQKLKMSDVELGEMIRVLDGKNEKWSTVHVFGDNQNNLWVNRSDDGKVVFVKVNDVTKALSQGEQECLRLLLAECIVTVNS
jgi:hypothetical protein